MLDSLSNPSPAAAPLPAIVPAQPETLEPIVIPEGEKIAAPESVSAEDRFASKFAALSKKEKEIKRQQTELRERLTGLEERELKYKSHEARRATAKEDPLAYLDDANLTYDDLTQYYLNGKRPTAETKMGALESKLEKIEQRLQEKLKEEESLKIQVTLKDFQSKIAATLTSDSERYELTNTFGNSETVYNLIDQHYQETGNILEIEEACDMAESFFEKQADEQASKMLKVKKLANKFSSSKTEEPPKAEVSPTVSEKRPTLTNELSQTIPNRTERPMTDRERLKKAAELIKFTQETIK